MGMLKEFREFAVRGNVIDLAVAVVIGAAFKDIVSSLVDDVITPLLLTPALKAVNAQDIDKLVWGTVKYGKLLAAILKFFVIAFVLFLIIKALNSMKKQEATTAPPEPSTTEKLLMEIRDSLKK